MPSDAKDILKSLQKGNLPSLKSQPDSSSTKSTSGLDISQRGLDRSTFGLQVREDSKQKKK